MNVYYLGRENKPGVKKFVDFYFVDKKTGKFLVKKNSDRSKESYLLHHNGGPNLITTRTETEVEYKNLISAPIISPTHTTVLEHLRKNYYNMAATIKEIKTAPLHSSPKSEELVTYITGMGSTIQGTMEQVLMICKQIGEVMDLSKLSGYDHTKYYFSNSKKELMPIKEMNTMYLMNSIAKKIRDYFDSLKVDNTFTVSIFKNRLEAWTDDKTIQSLVNELATRE